MSLLTTGKRQKEYHPTETKYQKNHDTAKILKIVLYYGISVIQYSFVMLQDYRYCSPIYGWESTNMGEQIGETVDHFRWLSNNIVRTQHRLFADKWI
jgi:hypothetical protein